MTWAPDYLTTEELKSYLRIGDTVDDVELATAITAASRAVDACCGRQFGQVPVAQARTYTSTYNRQELAWEVEVDDLTDLTSLAVTVDGTVNTAYTPGPVNAVSKGKAYTRLVFSSGVGGYSGYTYDGPYYTATAPNVVVTALWGWTSVPDTVVHATKIQAHRFITRRDAPLGVAGSPDQGSELRLLARVDPDVELMLSSYRRRWGAV